MFPVGERSSRATAHICSALIIFLPVMFPPDPNYYNKFLMDGVAMEVMERLKQCNPQDVANSTWAFGKLWHDAPALMDAVAEEATGMVKVTSLDCCIQSC